MVLPSIRPHHQHTIDLLTERFRDDPRFSALVIGGSVVKGRARDDSDVDVLFVATDEEYAVRRAAGDICYYSQEFCDYPGGYVDGKFVDLQFVRDVADHGSEPARSAFIGAFAAYSRIDGLDELIEQARTYPEHERAEKIEAFYAQVELLGRFFVAEAAKRGDAYLMAHSTADLVLYGARLVLAHNRIIYPYHKWLMTEVARAPEKPDAFEDLAAAVLAQPGPETALRFCEAIERWRDWGIGFGRAVSRFIEDNEWNWRDGRPPVEDW